MRRTVFTSKGTPLEIGRELGRGGEGSVFEVAGLKDQVAKLYHKAPDSKKQAKLRFMASAADEQLVSYVAWPQDTLHPSRGGPVIGFLMPRVAAKEAIHMVYSPAHRRQDYPKAAWDFLLFVSRNIAASFEAVHSHGHVIGDVNQDSVMVGRDSKVVLIDSDSYQVDANGTLHLCEVGVSHFTPPELQSISSFDGYKRTANHDRFGLALLIFHVLFGGRHPFSGVPQRKGVGDALEADIKHFRYAYARDSQARGFKPPPRSIPISIVPDSVESMFHAAFTETGSAGNRPTAQQWVAALDSLRGRLRKCGASPMHLYPDHLARCPWCALEQEGVVYFLDLGTTFMPSASGFVLTQIWALIQAVPAPQPLSIPNPNIVSVTAQQLPPGMTTEGTTLLYRVLAVGCAAGVVVLAPGAWFLALLGGWAGWVAAGNVGSSARSAETAKRKAALDSAKDEYDQLIQRAQREAGREGFQLLKADFDKLRRELEGLGQAEKKELDALQSTAHERQKQKFLDNCFIDSASIPGVGPARKAALRSFGIETAADVTRHRVMQVRGFGDGLTRAVLDWKASCERRFTFNPAAAVSNADRAAVKTKFATRKATVEKLLAAAPAQLRKFAQEATSRLATLQPRFESAAGSLAQAQADYAELSGRSITSWSSLPAPVKFAIAGLAALALIIFASTRNSRSPVPLTTSYSAPTTTTTAIPSSATSGRASGSELGKQIAIAPPARGASSTGARQAKTGTPARDKGPSDSVAGIDQPSTASSARAASETEVAPITEVPRQPTPVPMAEPSSVDSIDPQDQASIERVCAVAKRYQGAIQYETCVRTKTTELGRHPSPNLDGLPASDVASLARACGTDLRFNGPGAYNACLSRGLAALRLHPEVDISSLPALDREAIERACRTDKQFNGPGPYNSCVKAKVGQLARSPALDLSSLSDADRTSLENSCRTDRQFNGPGAYNACVKTKVEQMARSPAVDLSSVGQSDRSSMEGACRTDRQFNGPGAYNACLAKKLNELQRNPPADLTSLSPPQLSALHAACRMEFQFNGPGAYNACVSKALRSMAR